MAKALNFNNLKKQFLTVTLPDVKNTTLLIGTPTKAIMTELVNLQESLTAVTDDNSAEAADGLYEACAKIMSRNKAGINITSEFLGEIFDYEDIMIFFNAYMEFIDEVSGTKN